MEPTLQQLKENYQKMPDDRLTRLAVTEAASLRPEALEILKEEIAQRGLNSKILNSIDAQTRQLTPAQVTEYCEMLQNLPCPMCDSSSMKLNANMHGTAMSFIVITSYQKKLMIACPDCLQKAHKRANLKTALLGWWGIPWGIIRTIQMLIFNNKMKRNADIDGPSNVLLAFVAGNVGNMEAMRNSPNALRQFLIRINSN